MTEPRDEITLTDLRALPPTIGLDTAARLLGIGRTTAQMLARNDKVPVPVLRVGSQYRVPTAPLLRLLGVEDGGAAAG